MALTSKGEPGGLATLDSDGRVPAAQTTQAAAVADLGALTAANAVGDAPTDEEFDAVVADLTAVHAKVNELLGVLRDAGKLASS